MGFFDKKKKTVEEMEEEVRLANKNPANRYGKSGRKNKFKGKGPTKWDEKYLRIKLCNLVNDGIYTKKRIVELLHKEHPRYLKNSINIRIVNLCNHTQACTITDYTGGKYEGKVACIKEGTVQWNKKQRQSWVRSTNVRKSTDYKKSEELLQRKKSSRGGEGEIKENE